MLIKDIKVRYRDYLREVYGGGNSFRTVNWPEYGGKIVLVVNVDRSFGDTLIQAVRVSDGVELLGDRSRPCDSLDDAEDVAWEMLGSRKAGSSPDPDVIRALALGK